MNDPSTSGAKHDKTFDVVVNAQPYTVHDDRLTFERVVELAYGVDASNPDKTFTMTYRKSDDHKHDGTLSAGQSVKIKDGTVFSVTSTTRS